MRTPTPTRTVRLVDQRALAANQLRHHCRTLQRRLTATTPSCWRILTNSWRIVSGRSREQAPSGHSDGDSGNSFLAEKFQEAFGTLLIHGNSLVKAGLTQTSVLCGGRLLRFNILAEEIECCNAKRQLSEREFIFPAMVMRNKMVRKARGICRLLAPWRRMDMWEAGQMKELLLVARRCNQQLICSLSPMSPAQVEGLSHA